MTRRQTLRFLAWSSLRLSWSDYLRYAFTEAPIEPLEAWTGILAVLWGLHLANPFVHTFGTAPGFVLMARIAPEWVWGCSIASAGAMQIYARLRGWPRVIQASALILGACWLFVGVVLIITNWRWTSTVYFPMLGITSLVVSNRALWPPRGGGL